MSQANTRVLELLDPLEAIPTSSIYWKKVDGLHSEIRQYDWGWSVTRMAEEELDEERRALLVADAQRMARRLETDWEPALGAEEAALRKRREDLG